METNSNSVFVLHTEPTQFKHTPQNQDTCHYFEKYTFHIQNFLAQNANISHSLTGWSQKQLFDSLINNHFYFLLSNQNIIAIAIWQPLQIAQEAELLLLEVTPQHQRQGYAKILLTYCLTHLNHTQNCQQFFLEVRASNIAAQRLYQSLHFKIIGRRKNYYSPLPVNQIDQSYEDAIIMKCFIS